MPIPDYQTVMLCAAKVDHAGQSGKDASDGILAALHDGGNFLNG
jgi:hypothetical protein